MSFNRSSDDCSREWHIVIKEGLNQLQWRGDVSVYNLSKIMRRGEMIIRRASKDMRKTHLRCALNSTVEVNLQIQSDDITFSSLRFLLCQRLRILLERPGSSVWEPLLIGCPVPSRLMAKLSSAVSINSPSGLKQIGWPILESEPISIFRLLMCILLFRYYLWHTFTYIRRCTHLPCTFFCDGVCSLGSATPLFQWISGKFQDCLCAGLENMEACNQSSGCFSRNPSCLSLHCSPIKGALITGNSAGNGAGRLEVGTEKDVQTCSSPGDVVLKKKIYAHL